MAFSLSNIYKNLFPPQEQSFLGVDIGASSIKVVQLSRKHGKAVLETYGEIALAPYDGKEMGKAMNMPAEKIAEALTDLCRESAVTAKQTAVAIPFTASLVSLIELPSSDPKQLEQMVPIEARKYIPVPISEVLLDWMIIPKETKVYSTVTDEQKAEQTPNKIEKSDVMVVAIHNDTVKKYKDISSKTNLVTAYYEIEMFSTIRALLDQNAKSSMIIDIGAGATKLYVVEQGIIKNTHLINRGSQDITLAISNALGVPFAEAETIKRTTDISSMQADRNIVGVIDLTLDYIFSEANQVLLSYEKRYNKAVSQILLIGGGALLQGILPTAKRSIQIDVALGQPFSKVQAPAFLQDVLKSANPEFSVAVGAALRMLQET
jgi:type IV pilus assembly protein PilM